MVKMRGVLGLGGGRGQRGVWRGRWGTGRADGGGGTETEWGEVDERAEANKAKRGRACRLGARRMGEFPRILPPGTEDRLGLSHWRPLAASVCIPFGPCPRSGTPPIDSCWERRAKPAAPCPIARLEISPSPFAPQSRRSAHPFSPRNPSSAASASPDTRRMRPRRPSARPFLLPPTQKHSTHPPSPPSLSPPPSPR